MKKTPNLEYVGKEKLEEIVTIMAELTRMLSISNTRNKSDALGLAFTILTNTIGMTITCAFTRDTWNNYKEQIKKGLDYWMEQAISIKDKEKSDAH